MFNDFLDGDGDYEEYRPPSPVKEKTIEERRKEGQKKRARENVLASFLPPPSKQTQNNTNTTKRRQREREMGRQRAGRPIERQENDWIEEGGWGELEQERRRLEEEEGWGWEEFERDEMDWRRNGGREEEEWGGGLGGRGRGGGRGGRGSGGGGAGVPVASNNHNQSWIANELKNNKTKSYNNIQSFDDSSTGLENKTTLKAKKYQTISHNLPPPPVPTIDKNQKKTFFWTPLHQYIYDWDTPQIRDALKKSLEGNVTAQREGVSRFVTPLHVAVLKAKREEEDKGEGGEEKRSKGEELVRMVVNGRGGGEGGRKWGGERDERGETALGWACGWGEEGLVKILVEEGGGRWEEMGDCKCGCGCCVCGGRGGEERTCSCSCDLSSPLFSAVCGGYVNIVSYLLKDYPSEMPTKQQQKSLLLSLFCAIDCLDGACTLLLLQKGAGRCGVDGSGPSRLMTKKGWKSLIFECAKAGFLEVVEYLLERRDQEGEKEKADGWALDQALVGSVVGGRGRVLEKLLELKSNWMELRFLFFLFYLFSVQCILAHKNFYCITGMNKEEVSSS